MLIVYPLTMVWLPLLYSSCETLEQMWPICRKVSSDATSERSCHKQAILVARSLVAKRSFSAGCMCY
jgi:hypothetical protein